MKKHDKPINKKIIVLSIIKILFFIALVVSIVSIIKWYFDNKQTETLTEKVSDAILIENEDAIKEEYTIDFEKLKEINNQVIGWIKVKGTNIEYPIVQAKDNNYYLNRNLEKKYNSAGSIFADYKNKFDGTDKNIILYGHNRKDGSMFGTLKNVLNSEWYENEDNYIIDFITENEKQKYQVFSVYQIQTEDYYINTEFKDGEFEKFVTTLKNRSKFDFDTEVSNEDSILTLSTCANNYRDRIVLHAKKIKD